MNFSRLSFILSGALLFATVFFLVGLVSGYQKNSAFVFFSSIYEDINSVFATTGEVLGGNEQAFLQPVRGQGKGVTINERADDDKLILLSGFFDGGNEIRLIKRDGSIVSRWPVKFYDLFPDPKSELRKPASNLHVDIHGMLIHRDGSVVFNFEYSGTAKLDRCNKTLWTLDHPTHHSLEWAGDGGYWIIGRKVPKAKDTNLYPLTEMFDDGRIKEDLFLKVSEDGEILQSISIPEVMMKGGLEAVLTAHGRIMVPWAIKNDREIVHANKIGELSSELAGAFPDFEAGDLIVSLREYNLVFIVDPNDWRVKWHQTGPWLRQHDPEFNPDGTITVFNNNAYQNTLVGEHLQSVPETPRTTNIIRVNLQTGENTVAFGERPGQEMLSHIRGKHEVTAEGGFLITEFEAGRVIETDAQGNIVWEYINQYNEDYNAEITEARIFPASYFSVNDWSCPAQ